MEELNIVLQTLIRDRDRHLKIYKDLLPTQHMGLAEKHHRKFDHYAKAVRDLEMAMHWWTLATKING